MSGHQLPGGLPARDFYPWVTRKSSKAEPSRAKGSEASPKDPILPSVESCLEQIKEIKAKVLRERVTRSAGDPTPTRPSQQSTKHEHSRIRASGKDQESRIPGPRATEPIWRREASTPIHAKAAAQPQSLPGAKGGEILRTDKNSYDVLRSADSRAYDPKHAMSTGVLLIRDKKTCRFFVEKRLAGQDQLRKDRAAAEVHALQQIKEAGNPTFINQLFEAFHDGKARYCSLVLEYCDAGTVQDAIKNFSNQRKPPPEDLIWHVLAGIAKAIHFLHTRVNVDAPAQAGLEKWSPLCHLDIKPSNIFLSREGQRGQFARVVLGDFGCVTTGKEIVEGKAERTMQLRGTPGWFPPECILDTRRGWKGVYGMPTDVWQMAGVAHCMCFLMYQPEMAFVDIGRATGSAYSNDLNYTVNDCMARDWSKRPLSGEVVSAVERRMERKGLLF
ncbi:hypothetical protein LTR62_003506 [Meristemomyces frigidus]|uniref:non-specific serine/threonine protein kinase n=1 Tax=Meristemomyces frigidus TaxID=1508187 RepID=A0AAN7TEZ2_9PEZI|nr:hypothetical protein LTR62_003506 [Meristemomyces frigidus]